MVMQRFFREVLLGVILLAGLIAMNVWAAPQKKLLPSTLPQQSYFDRFRESVEDEIVYQLSKSMAISKGDIQVSLESLRVTPALPELSNYSVQVLGLGSEGAKRLDGMISLTVYLGGGRSALEFSISALMKVVGPVVTAQSNLPRGRLIEETDLETKILPWKNLPTGAGGVVAKDVVGRRVKTFISSGAPVWSGMLEEQVAIRSGDQVAITVLSGPGVIIHSRGIARQEGRMGESIRIEQPDTRKTLSAIVIGEKAVEVRL